MGNDAAGQLVDVELFMPGPDDNWEVSIHDADQIAQLLDWLNDTLADPSCPELSARSEDGADYDHEELSLLANEAADTVRRTISQRHVSTEALSEFASATLDLRLIGLLLFHDLPDEGTDRKDAAMGFIERMSVLVSRALEALDRTVIQLPDGRFRLRWSTADTNMLDALRAELDRLLDTDDQAITRLFPPAYGTDADKSREFDAIARFELIESRRASLEVLAECNAAESITEEQLHSVMRAINDLRLVVGTRLDVGENEQREIDPNDPDFAAWVTYERLTHMVGQIVRALSSADS